MIAAIRSPERGLARASPFTARQGFIERSIVLPSMFERSGDRMFSINLEPFLTRRLENGRTFSNKMVERTTFSVLLRGRTTFCETLQPALRLCPTLINARYAWLGVARHLAMMVTIS